MSQSGCAELEFAMAVLEKMRIHARVLDPADAMDYMKEGIGRALGFGDRYATSGHTIERWMMPRTIYKIEDPFLCHYICMNVSREALRILVIGPYLTHDPAETVLLELIAAAGAAPELLPQLREYYAALPVYQDTTALMAVVSALGDRLWGAERFAVLDMNHELRSRAGAVSSHAAPIEQEHILRQMEQIEARYAYEDRLMELVSRGLTAQTDVIMASVSHLNYQLRAEDPLRNMKNYCVICNTLLRKAAQKGGVHPYYLDRISGQFARTIEHSATQARCGQLIGEMIRAYCGMVREKGGKMHSPLVQNTLIYIDENLSGDLSLTQLARRMEVSPGYLSTRFHRETGSTLAAHITAVRMKNAVRLLGQPRLQIQAVAQLCGFADPNYFARQFKRFYGMTPLQYRKNAAGRGGEER